MSSALGRVVPLSNPSSVFNFFNSDNDGGDGHAPMVNGNNSKKTNGNDKSKRSTKTRKRTPKTDNYEADVSSGLQQTMVPPSSTISVQNRTLMPHATPDQDSSIGPLVQKVNPEQLGFQHYSHPPRDLPRYLIQQIPQLKPKQFIQDPWDKSNQEKMLLLEGSVSDVDELYETLKKMRDVERKVMEDRGLVDKADLAKDLNDAIVFQGTCLDMCPIFERARRSVENNVVRYEKDGSVNSRISRFRALKVFARPAAAAAPPLPSDVRPPHILVKTLDYIVDNIVPLLPDCESFLWDRMRSIRQDFTYQNYSGPEAVDCNERIVRIHLLILHVMAKFNIEYSSQQELEQLHKALITLSEIYGEVRSQGGSSPNEAEFRAYSLLSKIRDPEYDKMAQELPEHVFQDDLVQLALCFRRIVSNSAYVERGHIKTESCMNLYARFFELIKSDKVPFLMSSFLEVYLTEIRFYAFKALSFSLNKKHKSVPFDYFMDNFLFNDYDELIAFCKYYSIQIEGNTVALKSLTHHSHILPDTKPPKQSYLKCVDEKLQRVPLNQLINAGKTNVNTIPSANEQPTVRDYKHGLAAAITESSKAATQFPSTGFGANFSSDVPFTDTVGTPSTFDSFDNHNNDNINNINLAHNLEAINKEKDKKEREKEKEERKMKEQELGNQSEEEKNRKRIEIHKQLEEKRKELEQRRILQEQRDNEIQKQKLEQEQHAKREKLLQRNTILSELTDELTRKVVHKFVHNIVEDRIKRKNEKETKLEILSEELYHAFIHEKLYFTFLETKAEKFEESRTLKRGLDKWKEKYNSRKLNRELKKRKREELLRVGKKLGVPTWAPKKKLRALNDSPGIGGNNSFLLPSSSASQILYTPTPNEDNHFTTPVRKNSTIWEPIDLKEIYFNRIALNLESIERRDLKRSSNSMDFRPPRNVDIFVYSKNWNSISGSWLLSKFGLGDNQRHPKNITSKELSVNFTPCEPDFVPSVFQNLQLLVFNTGVTDSDIFDLEMRLRQDGEKLIELVHGIVLNTNYKFEIMLIYWESAESPLNLNEISKFLKLNKISKIFGTVITKIEIVKMTDDNPHKRLADGLTDMASSFKFELTERGEYNQSLQQRSLSGVSMAAYSSPFQSHLMNTKNIDEKMHRMLELEKEKYEKEKDLKNTYAHLRSHAEASPRSRKGKLQVLLSESLKNKFKTPLPIIVSDKRLSSSFSLPSVSSHLAAKVKMNAPSTQPTLLGTPSHTRNTHMNNPRLLQTPSIAAVGSQGTANTSGLSNITFGSEFSTPINDIVLRTPQEPPARPLGDTHAASGPDKEHTTSLPPPENNTIISDEVPKSVLELKDLIASVKKKLNK